MQVKEGIENCIRMTKCAFSGSDRASSKGYIVRWVEAPSNKLLTTTFEASLGSVSCYVFLPVCVRANTCWKRMEECHSDVVSEIQGECVFPEVVFLIFCDLTYSVPNPVKPKPVDESVVQCHGRMGYMEDGEW